MGLRLAASLMVLFAHYAYGFMPGVGLGAALRVTRSRGQRCSMPALRSSQGGNDDDGRSVQTPVRSVRHRGASTAL